MPSILIVDDHMLVRRGLRQILAEEFRDAVFSEASTADEALAEVARRPWELVTLNTGITGQSGLHLLQAIRKVRPKASVLVVSVHPAVRHAIRAFELGAMAYVTKDTPRSELVKAVRSLLAGRKYLTASLSQKLRSEIAGDHEQGHETLSAREFKVMLAIATGKRTGEIATEWHLSAKTVSTYRHRILSKLGLKSNADVVRYVIDHQLS